MELEQMHLDSCQEAVMLLSFAGKLPSYFQFMMEGKVKRFDTPWNNQVEKEIYVAAIRLTLKEYPGIEAYSFITEAWMASVDMRTQPELEHVAPRDRSDREDVLLVMTRHRNGGEFFTKYLVEYDADGSTIVGPAQPLGNGHSEGFLGNLFEDYYSEVG